MKKASLAILWGIAVLWCPSALWGLPLGLPIPPPEEPYRAAFEAGKRLFEAKDYQNALLKFKVIVIRDPFNARAMLYQSRCYKGMGIDRVALRYASMASLYAPKNPEIRAFAEFLRESAPPVTPQPVATAAPATVTSPGASSRTWIDDRRVICWNNVVYTAVYTAGAAAFIVDGGVDEASSNQDLGRLAYTAGALLGVLAILESGFVVRRIPGHWQNGDMSLIKYDAMGLKLGLLPLSSEGRSRHGGLDLALLRF